MGKKCLKCGYERQTSDVAPDYECPNCGAIYAKVEAHHAKSQNPQETQDQREETKQTKRCPFCGEEILHVAIKCKHCGSLLEEKPVINETFKNQSSRRNANSRALSPKEIIAGLGLGAAGIALAATGSLDKLWAHLISPFDPRPTVSFTELVQNPESIREKKKELCAWAKREELRNPSTFTSAARKGACEGAE